MEGAPAWWRPQMKPLGNAVTLCVRSTCFWLEKGQPPGQEVLKGNPSVLPHVSWSHRMSFSLFPTWKHPSPGTPGCMFLHPGRLHAGKSCACPSVGLRTKLRWDGSGDFAPQVLWVGAWQDTSRATLPSRASLSIPT